MQQPFFSKNANLLYESFIKEWLLNNQSRVYSVIVRTYRQKLEELKSTLFRKWLIREIDVPDEKINLSSLNSAITRQKKRDKKNSRRAIPADANPSSSSATLSNTGFKFSKPNTDDDKNSSTKEY